MCGTHLWFQKQSFWKMHGIAQARHPDCGTGAGGQVVWRDSETHENAWHHPDIP